MRHLPRHVALSIALFFAGKVPGQESMMSNSATAPSALPAASSRSRAEEILRRFDKNGDGRIDEDEKAEAHDAVRAEQMAKETAALQSLGGFQKTAVELFDRNGDTRLDENERLDALDFVQQSGNAQVREALFKRADKDQDGKLDQSERRELQLYAEEHRGELMQELLLKNFDRDGSGELESAETATIREAFRRTSPAQSERLAVQRFLQGKGSVLVRDWLRIRFDANRDGKLDADEQRAAQDHSQQYREEVTREAMLHRFDVDGDGFLETAERISLRAEIGYSAPTAEFVRPTEGKPASAGEMPVAKPPSMEEK